MAGFRNRLVHFYQEVSDRELHEICTSQLDDPEEILKAILDWIKAHPEKLDQQL